MKYSKDMRSGKKSRRLDTRRHDSSWQKSTRLIGSLVARDLA